MTIDDTTMTTITEKSGDSSEESRRGLDTQEIWKTTLNLVIFCFITAFLLSFYYQATKGRIDSNARLAEETARKELLVADEYCPLPDPASPGAQPTDFKAIKDSKLIGYVVKTSPAGYSGKIDIMYSTTPDFKILNVKILKQTETPGLGDKVEETVKIDQFKGQTFVEQFKGKGSENLEISQSRTPNPEDIAAITGATVSSAAVTKGIRESLEQLKQRAGGK